MGDYLIYTMLQMPISNLKRFPELQNRMSYSVSSFTLVPLLPSVWQTLMCIIYLWVYIFHTFPKIDSYIILLSDLFHLVKCFIYNYLQQVSVFLLLFGGHTPSSAQESPVSMVLAYCSQWCFVEHVMAGDQFWGYYMQRMCSRPVSYSPGLTSFIFSQMMLYYPFIPQFIYAPNGHLGHFTLK